MSASSTPGLPELTAKVTVPIDLADDLGRAAGRRAPTEHLSLRRQGSDEQAELPSRRPLGEPAHEGPGEGNHDVDDLPPPRHVHVSLRQATQPERDVHRPAGPAAWVKPIRRLGRNDGRVMLRTLLISAVVAVAVSIPTAATGSSQAPNVTLTGVVGPGFTHLAEEPGRLERAGISIRARTTSRSPTRRSTTTSTSLALAWT